jgi:hypothetical protein
MVRRRDEKASSEAVRIRHFQEARPRWTMLGSVLEGMYTEVDKLAKKSPSDEITDLALKRVNTIIKETKILLKGDEFVDSIEVFVPAGENPELRDVLMILRELKQGMERWKKEYLKVTGEGEYSFR